MRRSKVSVVGLVTLVVLALVVCLGQSRLEAAVALQLGSVS